MGLPLQLTTERELKRREREIPREGEGETGDGEPPLQKRAKENEIHQNIIQEIQDMKQDKNIPYRIYSRT